MFADQVRSGQVGVDRVRLVVQPVVSDGSSWFGQIDERRDMTLGSATAYSNGAVGVYYVSR